MQFCCGVYWICSTPLPRPQELTVSSSAVFYLLSLLCCLLDSSEIDFSCRPHSLDLYSLCCLVFSVLLPLPVCCSSWPAMQQTFPSLPPPDNLPVQLSYLSCLSAVLPILLCPSSALNQPVSSRCLPCQRPPPIYFHNLPAPLSL